MTIWSLTYNYSNACLESEENIFIISEGFIIVIYLHIDISYNTFSHHPSTDIYLPIRCLTIVRAILRLPETFHLSQSSIMVQIMPKANKIVIEQLVLIELHFNLLELVTESKFLQIVRIQLQINQLRDSGRVGLI